MCWSQKFQKGGVDVKMYEVIELAKGWDISDGMKGKKLGYACANSH
jgi:hypothetical protein